MPTPRLAALEPRDVPAVVGPLPGNVAGEIDPTLTALLRDLRPVRVSGVFAFCELPAGAAVPATTVAFILEPEGPSAVLPAADARAAGLAVGYEAAWLTLSTVTPLSAVGLTAAVAAALAADGISCNVVAGARHDHLFVPADRAADAVRALDRLRADAGG